MASTLGEQEVSGSLGKTDVGSDHCRYDGCYHAAVELVGLYDEDGMAITRFRSLGNRQVCPPNVSSMYYHFSFLNAAICIFAMDCGRCESVFSLYTELSRSVISVLLTSRI